MRSAEHRSFQTPDETRSFPNAGAEIVARRRTPNITWADAWPSAWMTELRS